MSDPVTTKNNDLQFRQETGNILKLLGFGLRVALARRAWRAARRFSGVVFRAV